MATSPKAPAASPAASPPPSPPRNPGPAPAASAAASPAPAPVQASAPPKASPPRSLGAPPPPETPRKPKRAAVAQVQAQAPAPEASTHPELPRDPALREAALATVRDEATFIVGIFDMVASRLPPERPLSREEKESIQGPLEQVLYKYGGAIPCEWQLAISVGSIALMRWLEVREKTGPAYTPPPDGKIGDRAA